MMDYLFETNQDRVVEHWIMAEEWTKAIDVLNRQVSFAISDEKGCPLTMPIF